MRAHRQAVWRVIGHWIWARAERTHIHHGTGIALGFAIGFLGTSLAKGGHVAVEVWHLHWLLSLMADFIGYSLHGFGLIPIFTHGDKLWRKIELDYWE